LRFLKTVFWTLLFLVGFDLIGVVVSFLLDVTPVRGKSGLAFYAIWLVLGVFCGLLNYNAAGARFFPDEKKDWTNNPDSGRVGVPIIGATALVLAVLFAVCYFTMWGSNVEPADYFVPDHMGLTITYFVAILGSTILGHTALRPKPTPRP